MNEGVGEQVVGGRGTRGRGEEVGEGQQNEE